MIKLTIDGKSTTVPEGTTILEAARQVDTEIPVLCYHDATTSNGLCRLCGGRGRPDRAVFLDRGLHAAPGADPRLSLKRKGAPKRPFA